MKKMLTVLLVGLFTMGLASVAFAEDGKKFEPGRKAVEGAGFKIMKTSPGKDIRGKDTLVIKTDTRSDAAVEKFRGMYLAKKKVNGAQVVGMAHMTRSDTWNVTVREGDKVQVLKVVKDKDGSNLVLRQPFSVPIRRK